MLDWLDIVVRSFVFIAVLFVVTKMLGKKQISELSFFEYVSGITTGSIAGEVIMGLENSIWHGILAIVIFGGVTLFVDIISLKNKKFGEFIEGKSTVFIKDGKILEDNLKKEKYTITELTSLLRQKDVFNVADVEFATLEPRGDISVFLKKENMPLTPKDLGIKTPSLKEPYTVIVDGKVLDDSLTWSGKSRAWLDTELSKLNATIENVFFGQVNTYGELTIDLYDDKIKVPSPQGRPLLLAMLNKTQADLTMFSLQTENKEAQVLYRKNAAKLDAAIKRLKPFLKS